MPDLSVIHTPAYTPPAMPPSPAPAPARKARLLYCKAHVAIHPTAFKGDNVPGYLGLVEVHGEGDTAGAVAGAGLLVSWVPDEVLARMDEQDREGYRRVGELAEGEGEGEEEGEWRVGGDALTWPGFVFVSVPPPKGKSMHSQSPSPASTASSCTPCVSSFPPDNAHAAAAQLVPLVRLRDYQVSPSPPHRS